MNGRLLEEYDEAGHVAIVEYDFKGNPLEKVRRVINDDELTDTDKYAMDWTGLDKVILDTTEYVTTLYYDALNRVRRTVYPEDLDAVRKELVPAYNKAGTQKHTYAKDLLERYQNIFGHRNLRVERSFDRLGNPDRAGLGSIRLDVIEGPLRQPTAIFDFKFGVRGLSQPRIDQILRVGRFDRKTPIYEIKPWLTTKRN